MKQMDGAKLNIGDFGTKQIIMTVQLFDTVDFLVLENKIVQA